jgi:hypothetical protein
MMVIDYQKTDTEAGPRLSSEAVRLLVGIVQAHLHTAVVLLRARHPSLSRNKAVESCCSRVCELQT